MTLVFIWAQDSLPSSLVWQNSFSDGCKSQAPDFLLAVVAGPLSAYTGFLQWDLKLVLSRGLCLGPASVLQSLTSSFVTCWRKLPAFKDVPKLDQAHLNNLPILKSTDLRLYLLLQNPFTAAPRLVFD